MKTPGIARKRCVRIPVLVFSLVVIAALLSCSSETFHPKKDHASPNGNIKTTSQEPAQEPSTTITDTNILPTLIGHCWFAPTEMERYAQCHMTFTSCPQVVLSTKRCNQWLWIWCGQIRLFAGDYTTSRSFVRLLFWGLPSSVYGDLPVVAVPSLNDTPISGPAIFNIRSVNRFGACVVQPAPPGTNIRPPNSPGSFDPPQLPSS